MNHFKNSEFPEVTDYGDTGHESHQVYPTRREVLKSTAAAFAASLFGGGLASVSSSAFAHTVGGVVDPGPPYWFKDRRGHLNLQRAASYLTGSSQYRFPASHRLADTTADFISFNKVSLPSLRRNLLRLFVRCDYDVEVFFEHLNHDIRNLALPFTSRHINMTGGWLYPSGESHTGFDFAKQPQARQKYPDITEREDFAVVAVADGTIVGWDGVKLLTLEHESPSGRLFRTAYNMLRDTGVEKVPGGNAYEMGRFISRGEVIGYAHDAPHSAFSTDRNTRHLHFAMFLSHEIPASWQPNRADLFTKLEENFGIVVPDADRPAVEAQLDDEPGVVKWKTEEWFPVDPFGIYGRSETNHTDYGFVSPDMFNPVPAGVMPYAFEDPTGDRIPYFAGTKELRDDLSVQPLSLGTMAAMLG